MPFLCSREQCQEDLIFLQQILSELGVSATFVDLGRSIPKDLGTIVGAEVVVGFDLDRAPEEVASVMMDKATQGDAQYIFTADDLQKVNKEDAL